MDVDGNGRLNKSEVLEAVRALLPVNWRVFEAQSDDNTLWSRW